MSTTEVMDQGALDSGMHEAMGEEVASRDFVTMSVNRQLVGLPILSVQDVFVPDKMTNVPLAPPEVAGSLNLRGRIVTAIDMRRRLGLEPRDDGAHSMSVVVEHEGELYSLVFDEVGDVIGLPDDRLERNPPTLDPLWGEISTGVYRLDEELLVVLDVARILDFAAHAKA